MPLKAYYGRFITDGGPNFGANISWGNGYNAGGISQNAFFELQYNYSKSGLVYEDYYNGDREDLGDLKVHNALAGITKGSGNGVIEGYGGWYAGVTIFDVEAPEILRYPGSRNKAAYSALSPFLGQQHLPGVVRRYQFRYHFFHRQPVYEFQCWYLCQC
mgnify:CR=1 FL=1